MENVYAIIIIIMVGIYIYLQQIRNEMTYHGTTCKNVSKTKKRKIKKRHHVKYNDDVSIDSVSIHDDDSSFSI